MVSCSSSFSKAVCTSDYAAKYLESDQLDDICLDDYLAAG